MAAALLASGQAPLPDPNHTTTSSPALCVPPLRAAQTAAGAAHGRMAGSVWPVQVVVRALALTLRVGHPAACRCAAGLAKSRPSPPFPVPSTARGSSGRMPLRRRPGQVSAEPSLPGAQQLLLPIF